MGEKAHDSSWVLRLSFTGPELSAAQQAEVQRRVGEVLGGMDLELVGLVHEPAPV